MTTFDKLSKILKTVFEDDIDISLLTEQSRLKEDVGLNSIGMLYMAMALEEEFSISFTNDDFVTIKTVGDVIDRIESAK